MVEEVLADLAAQSMWNSPRLRDGVFPEFQQLLVQSCQTGTEVTLAVSVSPLMRAMEVRQTRKGPVQAAVPVNASEVLAEGEYNRYYIRALCRLAIRDNLQLEVFRAKAVGNPRPESEARIGALVPPQALLEDLRTGRRVDEALGVPAGPNSGLSVRFTT